MEVYNENIKDLLTSDDISLELREDPMRGVSVAGISEVMTTSTKEVMTMIKLG